MYMIVLKKKKEEKTHTHTHKKKTPYLSLKALSSQSAHRKLYPLNQHLANQRGDEETSLHYLANQ